MAKHCPNCGSPHLFRDTKGTRGSGYAANYLGGLGSFPRRPKILPEICEDCGLVQWFAEPAARAKLRGSKRWVPVDE